MRVRYVLLFVVLALFSSVAMAAEKRYQVPLNDSPWLGPENAPVTIIEFLDFQ